MTREKSFGKRLHDIFEANDMKKMLVIFDLSRKFQLMWVCQLFFTSEKGILVRSDAPVYYKRWMKAPAEDKEKLLASLLVSLILLGFSSNNFNHSLIYFYFDVIYYLRCTYLIWRFLNVWIRSWGSRTLSIDFGCMSITYYFKHLQEDKLSCLRCHYGIRDQRVIDTDCVMIFTLV